MNIIMKKTIKCIVAVLTVFFALSSGQAYSHNYYQDREAHDRMKAERVAYLTSAMDLTSAEAEKFWPVYNSMEKARKTAFRNVMEAYKALDEGLKAGKSEKEISNLLDKYVTAVKESRNVEDRFMPQLTKILSVEKVAKLFIGEEEFRRIQINRWGDRK